MEERTFNARDFEIIEFFRHHLKKNKTYRRCYLVELLQQSKYPNLNITALTYNRWNNGMGHALCLFVYDGGNYIYKDVQADYTGDIFRYPKGGVPVLLGSWNRGVCNLADGRVLNQTENGYKERNIIPNLNNNNLMGNALNPNNPDIVPGMNNEALAFLLNALFQAQGAVGRNALNFGQRILNDGNYELPQGLNMVFTRQTLTQFCTNQANSNFSCALAICAWGGMNYINAEILFNNWTDELDQIITNIRNGAINTRIDSYQALYNLRLNGNLPGCGVAFFTKFICFLNPKLNGYILDQWTGKSINLLFGNHDICINNNRVTDINDANVYENFCQRIEQLAIKLHCTPLTAEERIFSVGGRKPGQWRQYVRAKYVDKE